MTNQQGAPEALRHADGLESFAQMLPAYGFNPQPLKDAASELRRLAALVEAQQPAPSAAEADCWSIHFADERDFCLAASPLIGATYTVGADAAGRINKSPWRRMTFGKVSASQPSPTPQADSAQDEGTWTPEMITKMQAMAAALPRIGGEPAPQADSQPAPVRCDAKEGVRLDAAAEDEIMCGLQAAADVLEAISKRSRQVGDVIEPVNDIRMASRLAAEGYRRIGIAMATIDRAARAPADSVTAPAGRVYSANCKYATVEWLQQTSDVGGGDPKNSWSWPTTGDAVYLTPPAQAADSVLEDAARLEALHAAVTAIYLDDSSDFKSALGAVVRHLDPKLAGDLLAWPKRAFDISQARLDAARKQGGV